jgi:phosphatidylglycerol:prolipoprotein diacylglycerol transferase
VFPELFKIGRFTLYTHGVLAVIGIIFGSYTLFLLAKKEKLNTAFLFDNIIYSVLIGIIGARLTYFLLYREQFNSFSEIFRLWEGGMVSYGGFIPGVLTFLLLLKLQQEKIAQWLAISSIAFSGGLFWGRIGNIFAGEYAGRPTLSKFNIDGYIPVTLYEAFLLVLLALSLLVMYKRMSKTIKKYLFFIFVLAYTGGRFILDFWREESKVALSLSIGQLVSLCLFLFVFILLLYTLFEGRKKNGIIRAISE